MPTEHTLYTMPASLYSAKARAYLRTHQIPHREVPPGDPRYINEVIPAIGRWIIPVLQTPDGTLIQDTVPETLHDLLAYIGEELTPDMLAQVAGAEHWLQEHPQTAEGDLVGGRPDRRAIGATQLHWRGHTVEVGVLPYRIYMLQSLQHAFSNTTPAAQATLTDLFSKASLESLLRARPRRRVERRENLEVWGQAQEPSLPAVHAA